MDNLVKFVHNNGYTVGDLRRNFCNKRMNFIDVSESVAGSYANRNLDMIESAIFTNHPTTN